ncbi:MAG: GIY-YIG nuclease family protein [Nanoarchaeota archaeon]|nr:GIY-YIG nuclease family protein [Nanoarchaeota archaeon]
MKISLCKKVDYSMFHWGVTVPKELEKPFYQGKKLKPGTQRNITIFWDNKQYDARLRLVKRKEYSHVYQIRWDNHTEILNKVRNTFIHSYVILESKHESLKQKSKKQFRSFFETGQREVLKITPLNRNVFKFDTYIKIDLGFNQLFERLANENVFGWMFGKEKEEFIQTSTPWYSIKELKNHIETKNVIYYLADTKNKELYIGSANVLGNRVKRNRSEIPNWDKFRFDVIRNKYSKFLRRIENHIIRTVASLIKNIPSYSSLNISYYKLKNKKSLKY